MVLYGYLHLIVFTEIQCLMENVKFLNWERSKWLIDALIKLRMWQNERDEERGLFLRCILKNMSISWTGHLSENTREWGKRSNNPASKNQLKSFDAPIRKLRILKIIIYSSFSRQHNFIKIHFYHPMMVKKAADLLAAGNVLGMWLALIVNRIFLARSANM